MPASPLLTVAFYIGTLTCDVVWRRFDEKYVKKQHLASELLDAQRQQDGLLE